jgi:alkylation response protein AidB-like acyl-CoA dehydrogenase
MIDFALTPEQKKLQSTVRDFAERDLAPLTKKADREPDPQHAFEILKPAYQTAYRLGLATSFLPKEYGGGGVSNVDLQIAAEELCAVDAGFACILLVNGLALKPVEWFGSEDQKRRFIGEACNDPTASYLAGWTVSEPDGTASFDDPNAFPTGMRTTAVKRSDGHYVLNGSKLWPSSAAGWDMKGANVNTCVVRTGKSVGGKAGLGVAMVPRGTPGLTFGPPLYKLGQRSNQNNAVHFDDVVIPPENIFAEGNGDLVISKAFTWSGPVASIAAVGVARAAYEFALQFSKTWTGGGSKTIINHSIIGYTLADVAGMIEMCRAFSWKAAHYLDLHDSEGQAIGAMSKVLCGEMMLKAIFKCMQVVGVNALDERDNPLPRLYRDATVFPLYDAGNLGMQRRKIWGVMKHESFNPRALMSGDAIRFVKEMEGAGLE